MRRNAFLSQTGEGGIELFFGLNSRAEVYLSPHGGQTFPVDGFSKLVDGLLQPSVTGIPLGPELKQGSGAGQGLLATHEWRGDAATDVLGKLMPAGGSREGIEGAGIGIEPGLLSVIEPARVLKLDGARVLVNGWKLSKEGLSL